MTFCKEMSSRVEEHFFCKNICFLGIDTKVWHSFRFRETMAASNFELNLDLVEALNHLDAVLAYGQGSFASL